MNTKIMIAVLVGILCLYFGNIATGLIALISTIVGFIAVLVACVFTFQRLIDKQNR